MRRKYKYRFDFLLRKLKKRQPFGQFVKRSFSQAWRDTFGTVKDARLYLFRHRTKPKNRPRKRGEGKPTKNDSIFLLSFVCRCVAVLSTLFRDEFARRACRVNLSPLPLIEPSQKNDRASGVRASRQKTTAFFAVVCLSVRSSFEHAISG